MRVLYSAAKYYNASFRQRPMATLCVTNGFLSGVADLVAQGTQMYIAEDGKKPTFDTMRSLRFITYGIAVAPIIGKWNNFLEHRFPLRLARKTLPLDTVSSRATRDTAEAAAAAAAEGKVSLPALGKRVLADQLVMAPFGMGLFISAMGIMEMKKPEQITDKFKDMYWTALIANWSCWPAIQLVNFRYMPLAYRIPFQSTCGIFWTLYLSLLNSKTKETEGQGEI